MIIIPFLLLFTTIVIMIVCIVWSKIRRRSIKTQFSRDCAVCREISLRSTNQSVKLLNETRCHCYCVPSSVTMSTIIDEESMTVTHCIEPNDKSEACDLICNDVKRYSKALSVNL